MCKKERGVNNENEKKYQNFIRSVHWNVFVCMSYVKSNAETRNKRGFKK